MANSPLGVPASSPAGLAFRFGEHRTVALCSPIVFGVYLPLLQVSPHLLACAVSTCATPHWPAGLNGLPLPLRTARRGRRPAGSVRLGGRAAGRQASPPVESVAAGVPPKTSYATAHPFDRLVVAEDQHFQAGEIADQIFATARTARGFCCTGRKLSAVGHSWLCPRGVAVGERAALVKPLAVDVHAVGRMDHVAAVDTGSPLPG